LLLTSKKTLAAATPTASLGTTEMQGLRNDVKKLPQLVVTDPNIIVVSSDISPKINPQIKPFLTVGFTKMQVYATVRVIIAALIGNQPVTIWSSTLATSNSAATVAYQTMTRAVLFFIKSLLVALLKR
jgi:hypothetical protein